MVAPLKLIDLKVGLKSILEVLFVIGWHFQKRWPRQLASTNGGIFA